MTARFDLGEFMSAGAQALRAYLDAHPALPEVDPLVEVTWPPEPRARSDIARLRVAFVRVAFELIRLRYEPGEAARRFIEVTALAYAAGEHAATTAIASAGYGEAAGRQRMKAQCVLATIADCMQRGITADTEMAARAGVSRRTLYRYLATYRGK